MEYICKIKKINEIVEELYGCNSKIICCCGCFDIFHIGHLEYLTLSKRLGDTLIVGVNSDSSYLQIKRKKPIFNVTTRMSIVAALECVNFVFAFEEPTFSKSLLTIKPYMFATGIDHKENHMEEEVVCCENNIEFMYIGEEKRTASSILANSLKR